MASMPMCRCLEATLHGLCHLTCGGQQQLLAPAHNLQHGRPHYVQPPGLTSHLHILLHVYLIGSSQCTPVIYGNSISHYMQQGCHPL